MKRSLKVSLLVVVALCLFSFAAFALQPAAVNVSWTASPSADVAGYRVHYGNATGSYTTTVDAGDVLTYTLENVSEGDIYLAVTAYDAFNNESVMSNEATTAVDATAPDPAVINSAIQVTVEFQ